MPDDVERLADETGKRYRTIVADPPWPFKWNRSRGMPYLPMALGEIFELPVRDIAATDAHLYLWVTPELHRVGEGARVARRWGFNPVSEIVWRKPHFGVGVFPRSQHEVVLICRKGRLSFGGPRNIGSVQDWSDRANSHSAKPEEFFDLVEQVSPEPRVELFARRARFGWDYWGDESLGTVEMPAA